MYGKIFASLWDGSLRGQPERQLVLIYLIAHASADGVVEVIHSKIADDTGLSDEQVVDALGHLEGPDDDSRSGDEDGRAIVPLDDRRSWGWRIVNYKRYRMLASERDRTIQNREAKQRQRDSEHVSKCQQPSAMSAQGEGEGEGEGEEEKQIPSREKISRGAADDEIPDPKASRKARRDELMARYDPAESLVLSRAFAVMDETRKRGFAAFGVKLQQLEWLTAYNVDDVIEGTEAFLDHDGRIGNPEAYWRGCVRQQRARSQGAARARTA